MDIVPGGYRSSFSTFSYSEEYSCKSDAQKLKEELAIHQLKKELEQMKQKLEIASPSQLKNKIRNRL